MTVGHRKLAVSPGRAKIVALLWGLVVLTFEALLAAAAVGAG